MKWRIFYLEVSLKPSEPLFQFWVTGLLLLLLLSRSVVSDSVRPQRWQPTRLPRPWDSPGKNAGVGCHFLLQCMKVKSESEVAQSCLTLSDPMDCSPPGSSVHGIFQARGFSRIASAVPISVWEAGLLHGHILLITRRETEDQLRPFETSIENWQVKQSNKESHLIEGSGVISKW